MAHRDREIAQAACEAVVKLLERDATGDVTCEAVQLAADLVRAKKCGCSPAVLSSLLGISLSEASVAEVSVGGV